VKWRNAVIFGSLFFCLGVMLSAQTKEHQRPQQCTEFVREFYDWYVPKIRISVEKKWEIDVFEFALKQRRAAFGSELFHQIEISKAEAERTQDPYIDFDPIVNSQEVQDGYTLGTTEQEGDTCSSEIFGVYSGKKDTSTAVVAELKSKNGRWFFVNFHYPSNNGVNENLLSILRYHYNDQPGAKPSVPPVRIIVPSKNPGSF
jgi:hypothetical protein